MKRPTFMFAVLLAILGGSASAGVLSYGLAPDGVYSVDHSSPAATFLFDPGFSFLGATDNLDGLTFYGTPAGGPLYRIDPLAQTATAIGAYGGAEIRELAMNEDTGVLYATDYITLYTVDQTSGAATPVGGMGGLGEYWAMDYHDALNRMFAISNTDDSLYEVDMSTGATTFIGSTGADRISDIWYDDSTQTLFGVTDGAGGDQYYTINTTTGFATFTGSAGSGNLTGLGWTVPAPGALALLGLAGLLGTRRRRRQ